jgi:asparagine synthase (glutamine-hydrolysing)
MCGIAGLIGRPTDSNQAALKRMNDAMAHRGPDGEAFWLGPTGFDGRSLMLAHRRLSIIDLSNAAAQPMVDPVTGSVLIFNGEIYNYQELRKDFANFRDSFQSTGDAAVMLRALSTYGSDAVGKLRGMFAFAFWDSADRKLMLARDPLGIKPLYFARNHDAGADWSLIFASEVRAILASGLIGQPKLNPNAVASIVWNGFVVSPQSVVAGIESVWPGQIRIFDSSGLEEQSNFYWNMPRPNGSTPVTEADIEQALEESVRLHLISDVPIGIFLSAGVDSSSIANLAQKVSRAPVHTFTLAFEEEEFNEGLLARRIANAIGTQHQEVLLTEQQFIARLDEALDSLDQPTFDGINSYYISHAVRDTGLKVALVGTGGDELFGGYTSFRDLPTFSRLAKMTNWLPRHCLLAFSKQLSRLLQRSDKSMPAQTRWAKLPSMVEQANDLLALYQLAYALFLPGFQKQLLENGFKQGLLNGLPLPVQARLKDESDGRSALSAISVMEQRLFLGERLLRDTDATSMSASIEIRLPLVDPVVLQNVMGLTDQQRYLPLRQKSMLRRIGLRGLDPALFARPKAGFVLPYDRWLRHGMFKVVDQTLRDSEAIKPTGLNPQAVQQLWKAFIENAPGIYWSRVWAIYVLVRWCHRHAVYL